MLDKPRSHKDLFRQSDKCISTELELCLMWVTAWGVPYCRTHGFAWDHLVGFAWKHRVRVAVPAEIQIQLLPHDSVGIDHILSILAQDNPERSKKTNERLTLMYILIGAVLDLGLPSGSFKMLLIFTTIFWIMTRWIISLSLSYSCNSARVLHDASKWEVYWRGSTFLHAEAVLIFESVVSGEWPIKYSYTLP